MKKINEIIYKTCCSDTTLSMWTKMMDKSVYVNEGASDVYNIEISYDIIVNLINKFYPNGLPENGSNVLLNKDTLSYNNPYCNELSINDNYIIFVHSGIEFFFNYTV